MYKNKRDKKAQLTIFVILALIIVVVIALAFVLIRKPSTSIVAEQNPKGYIEKCVLDNLKSSEETTIKNNLYLDMSDNYILYMNKKVKYLCKASIFYLPCVNQEPMLLEYVRKNIENDIRPEIIKCFSDFKNDLINKGYTITEGNLSFEVNFYPGVLGVNIDNKISMKKNDVSKNFESFETQMQSPLFNLVDTARSIVNYESTTCQFNSMNWQKNYRDISIQKFVTSEQTKVYSLVDKKTEKEIDFAVKTCVLPAGI